MEFITLLLPLLTQLLPLILNKPDAVSKQACLRRMARYQGLADRSDSSPSEAAAFGEMADLFGCLAEADEAGRQEIAGAISTAAGIKGD